MNKLILLMASLLLMNCSVSKKNENATKRISDNCPLDGECTIVLHENKSLVVKVDDIGAIYYQLEDNKTTSVIAYTYQRKVDETLQDANYSEDILFEIPSTTTTLNLTNEDLQATKMLYGRHCYCKGQAGYFKVMKGNLNLIKNKKQIQINLDFEITEVPQTIKTINTQVQ